MPYLHQSPCGGTGGDKKRELLSEFGTHGI